MFSMPVPRLGEDYEDKVRIMRVGSGLGEKLDED